MPMPKWQAPLILQSEQGAVRVSLRLRSRRVVQSLVRRLRVRDRLSTTDPYSESCSKPRSIDPITRAVRSWAYWPADSGLMILLAGTSTKIVAVPSDSSYCERTSKTAQIWA